MRITTVKLLALVCTGWALLGVTLAAETNKRQSQRSPHQELVLVGRNKRGLMSVLFGGGTGEPIQQAAEVPAAVASASSAAEVLPIYGDPAKPPLHMLYGHATGPYSPYPVMFIPGAPPLADGTRPSGQYLPMAPYAGAGAPGAPVPPSPVKFQPPWDANSLPAVFGWPEAPTHTAAMPELAPSEMPTTTTAPTPSTTTSKSLDVSNSAYLRKLNLSAADEAELRRLSKQLGVTDFEHLPPFEDVMALLGTTTDTETIKAIKEYASTPDGLALIKDYVKSYQPAKRISLGKQPYTEGDSMAGQDSMASTTPPPPAPVRAPEPGFFARQFQRLRSILTLGYFDGAEETTPVDTPTAEAESPEAVPGLEVSNEAIPFVTRHEYPGVEVQHGSSYANVPLGHYFIPVQALPPQTLSYAADPRYASNLPFPLAFHYTQKSLSPNPFPLHTVQEPLQVQAVPAVQEDLLETTTTPAVPTTPNDAFRREPTVAPQRVAPPTVPTGEVHTFEHVHLGQTEHSAAPSGVELIPDLHAAGVIAVDTPVDSDFLHRPEGLGPIVVEPELLDISELPVNTLDEQ